MEEEAWEGIIDSFFQETVPHLPETVSSKGAPRSELEDATVDFDLDSFFTAPSHSILVSDTLNPEDAVTLGDSMTTFQTASNLQETQTPLESESTDKNGVEKVKRLPWKEVFTCVEDELKSNLDSHFCTNGFKLNIKQTNNPTVTGIETQYRMCSAHRRYKCKLRVKIQKLNDDDRTCIVYTQGEHTHPMEDGEIVSPTKQPKHGLPPEMKSIVDDGVGNKKRPGMIYRDVKEKFKTSTVTPLQVYSRIKRVRKTEGSALEGITMGHIYEWCQKNELDCDSAHDVVGVLPGWEVKDEGGEDVVNITITSKALLSNLIMQANSRLESFFSADGTYKLLVNGYPVIVVGTVDSTHKYKSVSVTITSGEAKPDYLRVFMSIKNSLLMFLDFVFMPVYASPDSAGAIHNAMVEAFPGVSVAKCWAHLTRGIVNQRNSFSSLETYREFNVDVRLIHRCHTDELFDNAISLFHSKWSRKKKDIKAYQWFCEQWLTETNCRWFAGATGPGLQVVNNSQERGNRDLKEFVTRHLRMPLNDFIKSIFEELGFHTNESFVFPFNSLPKCDRPVWLKAQIWLKEVGKYIHKGQFPDSFVTPSTEYLDKHKKTHKKILMKTLRKDMNVWSKGSYAVKHSEGLEAYVARFSSFFALKKLENPHGPNWFSCQCVHYNKYALCKHSLGLSIRQRLVSVPPQWVGKTLEDKKRRGRPAKVGHCLER